MGPLVVRFRAILHYILGHERRQILVYVLRDMFGSRGKKIILRPRCAKASVHVVNWRRGKIDYKRSLDQRFRYRVGCCLPTAVIGGRVVVDSEYAHYTRCWQLDTSKYVCSYQDFHFCDMKDYRSFYDSGQQARPHRT